MNLLCDDGQGVLNLLMAPLRLCSNVINVTCEIVMRANNVMFTKRNKSASFFKFI